jgi:hypothetical protein
MPVWEDPADRVSVFTGCVWGYTSLPFWAHIIDAKPLLQRYQFTRWFQCTRRRFSRSRFPPEWLKTPGFG